MTAEQEFARTRLHAEADETFKEFADGERRDNRRVRHDRRFDAAEGRSITLVDPAGPFPGREQFGTSAREIDSIATHETRLSRNQRRDSPVDTCQYAVRAAGQQNTAIDDGGDEVRR